MKPAAPASVSSSRYGALLTFAAFALFLVYGSVRQRYIWGVDSFGYYELGHLISQGTVYLPLGIETAHPGALPPWGFDFNHAGKIIPTYPPGFPLLLAIGHLLRAPLWVTPACGVLSCCFLFGLLRHRVRESTALLFTAAWAVMPLTVYGATMLMSDLVAATAIMGGLLAFERRRLFLAACIFGFSFAVRPTNVIFFAPFCLLLRPDRTTFRFFAYLALPCLAYAAYNHVLHGAPWRTGYSHVWDTLSGAVFARFLTFFLGTTLTLLSPILIAFAVLGLWRPTREKLFLALWFTVFVLFYSFWSGGGSDRWWWARFILPGLPPLFLLAAVGFDSLIERMKSSPLHRAVQIFATLLVIALPALYLKFGLAQNDLWQRDVGKPNFDLVRAIERTVPPGSLVGSVEHASALYLYSRIVPFIAVDERAKPLVTDALRQGRRVFLLPEPWHRDDAVVRELLRQHGGREVARYQSPWPDLILYELQP